MKTANKAPKSSDSKRKAVAVRKLTVKPLDASKVKGGYSRTTYFVKLGDIKGESKD